MKREDFLSYKLFDKIITNRKKSKDGKKVMKIQKIINERAEPFQIIVEYYSAKSCPLTHISLKNKKSSRTFGGTHFARLYTDSRPITKKIFDDLQKLLNYIPTEYHSFYKSLKYFE